MKMAWTSMDDLCAKKFGSSGSGKLQKSKMISEKSQKMHEKTFEDEKRMTKETENSRGWDLTKMVFHQGNKFFLKVFAPWSVK